MTEPGTPARIGARAAKWPVTTRSIPVTADAAFASVSGYALPLPPLVVSMIGAILAGNRSPKCATPFPGKTTTTSPSVCPRPK